MDPTVAIPLQFTIETAVLTAAALLVAWAALRRQWAAAAAAVALTVAQALHAGQFHETEDEPLLLVLRAVAIVGLAATVLRTESHRRLFGAGLVLLAAGTIGGAIEGGGADDFAVVPHLLLLAGGGAILVWISFATRESVRLRVVVAFVSVLAVAVVVAGGAIARVAALDSRLDQYTRLGSQAVATRDSVTTTGEYLRRGAAANSSALYAGFQRRDPSLDVVQLARFDWAVLLGRDGAGIDKKAGARSVVPYARDELLALDVVEQARRGTVDITFATAVERQGLIVVSAAPVLRPTEAVTASDVVGVLVLGRTLPPSELGAIVSFPSVEIALVGERHAASSDRRLPANLDVSGTGSEFRTIDTPSGTWFATVLPLPGGNVQAVLATSDDEVVDAIKELVQAFLVAILAAAMLAVVAALWLSARITRPMLELADDAERVKADFLSSVSHELRTPLTPIRGYTELLRRGVPARSRPGYLDEIGNATQRLERIVSLLVDVAAMDAGRYQIIEDDISVRELFEAASQRWTDRKRPAQIQIRLPKTALGVRADPAAIARVLDELIDNAIKFSPETTVELAARRAGGRVEISVHDEGPGIDPERLAALKAPFATGERGGDTKRYGGLGLGLSFVEGVHAAHRSQLRIDTAPGRGTTCVFALPPAGSVTAMPAKAASPKR